MAYITAPDFRIRSIEWELDRPSQINVSAYTARRSVLQNPWHGKWRAKVELAMVQGESEFRLLRSFFARCEGQVNAFRLYATVEAQNSNVGVTVASAAAAGATSLSINGAATPLTDGQYFTVNGQLCVCIADQSGSTLTFEPPLRAAAAAGTTVVTSRPYALVSMASSSVGWSVGGARRYGVGFSVEEAIGDADGTASELSPFASSDYKLALKFTTASYWANATNYAALASVPGYSFTRSGEQGAIDSDDTIDYFAANVPAINGAGYHAYGALTNDMLSSNDFSSASWIKGSSGVSAPTITANSVLAPDGTTTADKVDYPAVSVANTVSNVHQGNGTLAAGAYTNSIFIRGAVGGEILWLYTTPDSSTFQRVQIVCSLDWQRIILPFNSGASEPHYFCIGVDLRDTGQSAQPAQSVYIWEGQRLAGNFPDGGPIIRTQGAAASIGESALSVSDAVGGDANQLFIVKGAVANSGNGRLCIWHDGTDSNLIDMYFNGSSLFGYINAAAVNVISHSVAYSAGDMVTAVIRRQDGYWRFGVIKDGVLTWAAAAATGAFPTGLATVTAANYRVTGYFANDRVATVARKLGTFDTDAKVLAAAAEIE